MLLPETLSILPKNPIFIAQYNVVTTYFIFAESLDLNIIFSDH